MRNHRLVSPTSLIALTSVLLAAGCGGGGSGGGGSSPAPGNVTLSVTDAPYPFPCIGQAIVTIDRVTIHQVGHDDDPEDGVVLGADHAEGDHHDGRGDGRDGQGHPGDGQGGQGQQGDGQGGQGQQGDGRDGRGDGHGDGRGHGGPFGPPQAAPTAGFTVIDSSTRAYDLVGLTLGKKALVTTKPVPAGTYDQLRLHVASGTLTLTDGRSFPLTIPSGSSSGIKIKLDPPVVVRSYLSQELVLDFDLAHSFEPVPASAKTCAEVQGFLFHPVLRAAVAEDSGAVAGIVTDHAGAPVVGATVTVSDSTGTVTHTVTTSATGAYFVGFLPPGTYTVTASTHAGATATSAPTALTVGNEASVYLKLSP